jgi:hypothetical protein
MELVLYAGLVNWLATWIIVEAEVFREVREWFKAKCASLPNKTLGKKLCYLVECQLCAGTWVGLGLSLFLGGPMEVSIPMIGWMLNGLLYKAVGHLILEVQANLMTMTEERRLRMTWGRKLNGE